MDVNERKARATEEAAQWWRRLGTLPPEAIDEKDRRDFTQWLRESPLHVAELLHISHVHDALGRFKQWHEIPLETLDFRDNVVARLPAVGERQGIRGLVAGIVAVSVVALAGFLGWLGARAKVSDIETDRAERREVVLRDGSIVNLEPETVVRVKIGKQQRYLTLARGRAVFHVAKDAARPFIVHAGETDVRAVGTVFGVDYTAQSTVVTVSEGKVAVVPVADAQRNSDSERARLAKAQAPLTSRGSANVSAHSARDPGYAMASGTPGEIFLTADQQLTVGKSGAIGVVQSVDSMRALAWSQGRLVFDSAPLGEVIQEFNRYNRVQLRLEGEELAHRTISGVFKANDPQTLIDFIGAGAHVVVKHQDNEDIVIAPSAATTH
jgi:transmembrane sensor